MRETRNYFVGFENISFPATPADQLLVVHYEQIRKDPLKEVRKILNFLQIEEDSGRLKCLLKYQNGFFKRKSKPKLSEIPFSQSLRSEIDKIIESVNMVLVKNGYSNLPTESYNYFAKTEEEILKSFKEITSSQTTSETEKYETENSNNSLTGSKMLLEQWIRF